MRKSEILLAESLDFGEKDPDFDKMGASVILWIDPQKVEYLRIFQTPF